MAIKETLSAFRLSKMRREVEQTASLVAPVDKPIKTEMSDHWAADLDSKTIFWRPTSPIPPHDTISDDEMLYLITHEAGHLDKTGRYASDKNLSEGELQSFHRLVNYVEDMRIERQLAKDFPGFKVLREDVLPKVLDSHKPNKPEDYSPLDQAGLTWMSKEMGKEGLGDPGWQKWAEAQWPVIDRLANADSTEEVSKGLIPIFDFLKDKMEHPTPPPPQPVSGGDGQGDGDGQEGGGSAGSGDGDEEGDGQGAGNGADDGDGDESKQGAEGGRKAGRGNVDADDSKQYVMRDFKPLSQDQVMAGICDDAKNVSQNLSGQVSDEANAQWSAHMAKDRIKQADGRTEADLTRGGKPEDNLWDMHKDKMRLPTAAFTRRLAAVLKTNSADNWQEGLRRGNLNTHRLHKTGAGNYRVFRKRTQIGSLDYTFGILVDVSGSMCSSASSMMDVLVMVCEGFEKNGINFFILPFNDGLSHGVKLSNQTLKSRKGYLANRIARPSGGTYEAPALAQAAMEFRKHPTGAKALISITDGETHGQAESQEIIRELREKHGIASFGIGIGCAAPSHYEEQITLRSAEALMDELPRIARTIMRKGGGQ